MARLSTGASVGNPASQTISPGNRKRHIRGAPNKRKLTDALVLLRRFEVVEFTQEDHRWATDQLIATTLSHNADIIDALISAIGHRLQIPGYTKNLKHFKPLIGELAQAPY